VLRPKGRHYSVVGTIFLDGAMQGEAVAGMPDHVKVGDTYGENEIREITLQ
jgi:hypothetical protein